MTLTEFLLARIAEDEARFRTSGGDGTSGDMNTDLHERLLAEYAAKRRIVALHSVDAEREWENPTDGPAVQVDVHTCTICGWVPDACDTVKALALPYADHSDYRQEWKP